MSRVHSVASFFVSRVDTEVDRRLEASGDGRSWPALRGKAAVAQAKLAYQLFQERFAGPRWEALQAKGAHRQRPLWASTSTKNPAYPDLLYVDSLIGPDTVNTMPDATVAAFLDHGTVARTVDQGVDQARADLDALHEAADRHGRRVRPTGGRGRGRLLQELRRAAAGARRQGQRARGEQEGALVLRSRRPCARTPAR